jgi:predicted metal-dependent peptidase
MNDQVGGAGVAATDGKNVIINPEKFFNLTLPQRVYAAAHEIGHNMFGDVELLHRCSKAGVVPMNDGSKLPFDSDTFQRSLDYRLNALLDESKIGERHPDWCHDPECKPTDSFLDTYKRHYKKKPDPDGDIPGEGNDTQGGNSQGKGSPGDEILPPGNSVDEDPNAAAQERSEQQWNTETKMAEILERANHKGKLPGGMQRMFKDLLEPQVSWLEQIETTIRRTTGNGGRTWRIPERRFQSMDLYLPSRTGYGAEWIVIFADTSGSRSDHDIAGNVAELRSIMEDVHPRRLTVCWVDDGMEGVQEFTDAADLANVKPKGGGGSNFVPAFEWLRDNGEDDPDMVIAFTDGYIDWPDHEPSMPLAVVCNTDSPIPYGKVIRVNPNYEEA